jgi:hypothetical protein
MSRALALFAAAAMAGCSTIDYDNRVDGWPQLREVEHKISFFEVQDRCHAFVGWGQWPLACATFHFRERECHIWYAFDWSLDHERGHCRGHDHPGEGHMARMWSIWNERQ